jgi:hypothetical protein
MTEHAKLSASGAHRWIRCPGSLSAEISYPDSTSDAAGEGTLAHEYAEAQLNNLINYTVFAHQHFQFGYGGDLCRLFIEFFSSSDEYENVWSAFWNDNKTKWGEDVVQDIDKHVKNYICQVVKKFEELNANDLLIEHRVDYSTYMPETLESPSFGTADVVIKSALERTIAIIDLKYGRINVAAKNNYQLMLYALGCLSDEYDEYHLCIYQPRSSQHWDIHVVNRDELLEFAGYARSRAEIALSNYAYKNPGHAQCQWCKHSADCIALFDQWETVDTLSTTKISLAQKAKVFKSKNIITKFIDKCEDAISDEIRSGGNVTGLKIVEGVGRNQFTKDAPATIRGLLGDDAFSHKLKSITEIKKICKSRDIDTKELDSCIVKKASEVLVDDTDKRDALYTNMFNAIDDNA